jgi:imidazolonepropionase-like amidohydrolase
MPPPPPFEARVALPPFAALVAPDRAVVVRAARAWTGALEAASPATIVLRGAVIESVEWGSADGAAPPGAETIVVSSEYTVLPGLIDCHSHPTFQESFDFERCAFETMEGTVRNLRTILRAGVTSVNGAAAAQLGVEAFLRRLVHAGRVEGPRWRVAGPELTPPGGLGAGIFKSPFETDCFGRVCKTTEELLEAVRECAAFGCGKCSRDHYKP